MTRSRRSISSSWAGEVVLGADGTLVVKLPTSPARPDRGACLRQCDSPSSPATSTARDRRSSKANALAWPENGH